MVRVGDKVQQRGTAHTGKAVKVGAGWATIVWDEGGYGCMEIERLDVIVDNDYSGGDI